jgi:hypothetical protein
VARSANVGGENPEFVLREFMGVNLIEGREAINDNEFFWAENIIPVAPAQAYPVPISTQLAASVPVESGIPSYTMSFSTSIGNFVFVVFEGSGNGYILNVLSGSVSTPVITGLTSGKTYATPYNNQGILIIDPTGYWDYSITTPNVLTPQNNTAAFATLVGLAGVVAGNTQLKQVVTGTGTGATFQAVYQVINATIAAAGTGYAVGDSVYLTDNSPTAPAQIIVASVGGGGNVTGITLATGGSYPGPTSSALVSVGPSGVVSTTTGSGTGFQVSDHVQATALNILTIGTGYTGTTTVVDETTVPVVVDTWDVTSSGVIGGQSVATYQGRVWISSNRTVFFTDIDSYNSFGGTGGSFFISDSYLVGNITVLYAANNYLYIFGQSSIDALSNVTVSAGVTSFSRINVTGTVGTIFPASVTAYYRAILFYHSSGIYLLAGATPEKISEKISQLTALPNTGKAFGFTIQIQGEICAGMQVSFVDNFTQVNVQRPILLMYFRSKWWFASYPNPTPAFVTTAITSIPINGVYQAFGWRANVGAFGAQLYQIFAGGSLSSWLLKTKFWDGGSPTREKQSINAAVGGLWPSGGATGGNITVNVDTELGTSVANAISGPPDDGYNFQVTIGNQGGSQYLGLTVAGAAGAAALPLTRLDMLALRGKTERDMMQ